MPTDTRPIFFPAIAHALSQFYNESDSSWIKHSPNITKSVRFFNKTKNPYFYHPYLLFNGFEHYKIKDIRKKKKIDKHCLMFADSGGFQLGNGQSLNGNYNKQIALEWSENNGDVFPILDQPLWNEYKTKFDDALKFTIESAEYYSKHRNPKLKNTILNVLQGNDIEEVEEWYHKIKHIKLDGWAIGGCAFNPTLYLSAIRMLYKHGEFKKKKNWMHIFGTSSFENMLYVSVIQKNMNNLCNIQLSYDSATLSHTTKFGKFFEAKPNLSGFVRGSNDKDMKDVGTLPVMYSDLCESIDKFRYIFLSKRFNYKFVKKDTKLPLPYSPAVNEITDAREFCKNKDTYFMIGNLHNLWMMIQQKELFDNLVFWNDQRVINQSIGNELKLNINVINEVFTKKELKKKYDLKRANILEAFNNHINHFPNRV
jgi:hypothetical protein